MQSQLLLEVITEGIGAKNILIGSTINAVAVAKKMHSLKGNWAIIGAGTRGDFRLEDQVGCALIAKYYSKLTDVNINSNTKKIINTYGDNIENHINASLSTKKLIQIGKESDVKFVIASLNKYDIVPVVKIYGQGESKRLSIGREVL